MWTEQMINRLVEKQRNFFRTNETLDVSWRIRQLKALRRAVKKHEGSLLEALAQDLGRSAVEGYLVDVGPTIMEIDEMIRGLRRWAKPETHWSGLACFPSLITKVHKMPYGVTLIISPFNFPVILTLTVLAASIAGGNTAVLKTSSKTPNCTAALRAVIRDAFPEEYVAVVDGGHDVADLCLAQRFDKIFYTGSPKVGVHIMEMAAKNLTPVALELGGENGNWCIIREDADLKDAARKIAFFKLCNSGQICININQVAVAESVAEDFVQELAKAFEKQIGPDPVNNPEYPHLITREAYDKCAREAEEYRDRIVFGGKGNPETLHYAPTIICPVRPEEPIANHELFNPLLPVIPFPDDQVDDILDIIAEREHGLALYIFTRDTKWAKQVMRTQQFGGGCINEVCVHMMVPGVPFGGTGHSGMGAYHGVWGFREFTHPQTVLYGSNKLNLPLREHPYSGRKNAYKWQVLHGLMSSSLPSEQDEDRSSEASSDQTE